MVPPEPCLGGCMQICTLCILGEAPSHHSHENLGERRRYGYAPVVVHVHFVAFALVQGHHLGISPGLGRQLLDGTFVQESAESSHAFGAQVLEQLQWEWAEA